MASIPFFLMIKPDGVQRSLVGEIIARFEKRGFVLQKMRMLPPEESSRLMAEHYKAHAGKHFYDELIDFSLSGPVVIMTWLGNIQVARSLVGDTIPWDAKPGTIRGDLASSAPANLIHCSADSEGAIREVNLWNSSF